MQNELIKKIREETEANIKTDRELIERMKIQERFLRRLVLTNPGYNEGIGKLQSIIRNKENNLKTNEKFLEFLDEIKNE